MNPSPSASPAERYRTRVDELESLRNELTHSKRPGDPAPVVGRVLEAAGDLLRRSHSIRCDEALIDSTLTLVSEAALSSWFEGVNVDEVRLKLEQASSEAINAAIPDSDDDGHALALLAFQGLCVRDRMESTVCALERLGKCGRIDALTKFESIVLELKVVDRMLRKMAARLTPLNTLRRQELNVLNAELRTSAWWFGDRSGIEDDALVAVLGGEARGTLREAERTVSEIVSDKHPRTVSFDELWRFDLGLSSPAEREVILTHAANDPTLKLAMAALEAGDAAIAELSNDRPQPPSNVVMLPQGDARAAARQPEIVAERAEFRVLVFRVSNRAQIVVQPTQRDGLAAAAVFLPEKPSVAEPCDSTARGFELDIADAQKRAGSVVRVSIRLKDGRQLSEDVRL